MHQSRRVRQARAAVQKIERRLSVQVDILRALHVMPPSSVIFRTPPSSDSDPIFICALV